MLINPVINEDNYMQFLSIKENNSVTSAGIRDIPQPFVPFSRGGWAQSKNAYDFKRRLYSNHFTLKLPSFAAALEKFKQFGLGTEQISENSNPNSSRLYRLLGALPRLAELMHYLHLIPEYKLSYPLAMGYADFLVVPQKIIHKFQLYCGVFAAANLHVETAAPTSLLLAQDDPKDLVKLLDTEHKFFGGWGHNPFAGRTELNTVQKLLDAFPQDYLYIHPVKLAKLDFN